MAEESSESVRTITDSKVLAAMAHPLRRRLIDVLNVDGPSTASMLAERTSQAVANVSHHMRVLADAALVEVAPELARDRRERWWRLASETYRWSSTSFDSDPSGAAIASAAESIGLERQTAKVREWYSQRDAADREWLEAAFSADSWLRLTPNELSQLCEEIVALFGRWKERASVDDGAARESVFVFAHGIPAAP
jgi:DNA-binding transcriptional ArsR family regulator